MPQALRVLIVEDYPLDAELVVRELQNAGFEPEWHRVDTESGYLGHLEQGNYDLIIADYGLPQFSGLRALELRNQRAMTVPFIVVSGVIGEDFAVTAMKKGAADYLLKDRLARLGPAVHNILDQSRLRRERAEAAEALQESQELFSKAFMLSLDGILLVRLADYTIVKANEAICRLWSLTPDEAVGRSITELIHWVSEEERAALLRTVREKGEVRNYETQFRLNGAGKVWFSLSARLITLNGEACTLTVLRNITDRRRSEESLRESEARFRAAFEYAEMGMILVSLDRRFLRVNDAFCRITGYTEVELLSLTTRDVSFADDAELEVAYVRNLLAGMPPTRSMEKRYRRKDGQPVWVAVTISLVRHSDGTPNYFVGLVEDLSQRRNLETQLRQAQKMEAIGQLAGGVAHDFNNILTAIMGHATLLTLVGPLPTQASEHINEINGAARRAASLTQQLLLFSRREVMQPTKLNLNDCVTNLARMLQRLIGADVRLRLHLDPRALIVHADAGMIDQVLMNLAVNARDAMPRGGDLIIETVGKSVGAEMTDLNGEIEPGQYACISVSDSGTGIPPDVLPRIFEPFFTTKEVGKGTGLGLATVFGIVKQHHGCVRVHSEVNRGTTFRVLLPLSSTGGASVQSAGAAAAPTHGRGECVLLVEDDESVHRMAKRSLERSGYRVVSALNAAAALQEWDRAQGKIDLLLTDLVMPGRMTGQELAVQLRAQRPELPVIFVSGYSAQLVGRELVQAPGQIFLQKPFEVLQLVAAVQELLNGRS